MLVTSCTLTVLQRMHHTQKKSQNSTRSPETPSDDSRLVSCAAASPGSPETSTVQSRGSPPTAPISPCGRSNTACLTASCAWPALLQSAKSNQDTAEARVKSLSEACSPSMVKISKIPALLIPNVAHRYLTNTTRASTCKVWTPFQLQVYINANGVRVSIKRRALGCLR